MASDIRLTIPKQKQVKLKRLALWYGLSMPDLLTRVLESLASSVPSETVSHYHHATRLKGSLRRALKDYQSGRVSERL